MENVTENRKLKQLTTKIGSGATPRGGSKVYQDSGVSLIRSQNVYNDGFSYDGLVHISDKHADELSNVEVKKGDILLNITGASVARSCQVPPDVLPARVNQHVAILRPIKDELDPLFLRYCLISPDMQQKLILLASAGATRQALTKGMIEDLEIKLPDIEEQRRIGKILHTYDQKRKLNQRMNETLEDIARAVFKSWFVDFDPVHAKMAGEPYPLPDEVMALFPDELVESELGMIPKGWEVGELGEFIKIFDSERIPLSRRERAKRKGKIPYYGATKIIDYVDDYLFDGVYVLMGEDGSVITEDGYPVLQYVWGKFWANNHAHVLQGKNGFSTEYLYILLRHKNISPFVTGAVQLKINQKNMKKIPVIKPNDKTMNKFDILIQELFNYFRYNQNNTEPLTNIRNACNGYFYDN